MRWDKILDDDVFLVVYYEVDFFEGWFREVDDVFVIFYFDFCGISDGFFNEDYGG